MATRARSLLHWGHRSFVVRRNAVACLGVDEGLAPRIAAAHHKEPIARLEPGRFALVDEDNLILSEKLVGTQTGEKVGVNVPLVAQRRHDRENPGNGAHLYAPLDNVQRLDDLRPGDVIARVPVADARRAANLNYRPPGTCIT